MTCSPSRDTTPSGSKNGPDPCRKHSTPPRPALWPGPSLSSAVGTLAARPAFAAFVLGTFTFVAAAGIGLLTGIPLPSVHDEFSYLLQADTFASGRLTNPTPPMWEHFETFHVILQPTYASKYPPGQGLMLALGQVLGHPVLGVWISAGLMVAAITWMLFAWVPPKWAVLTGLIVALQIGIASYWAQSYWGGAVAATGGALLYGALRRVLNEPSLRAGLLLGLGVAILAISRPFEGFLVSLPAAALLSHRLIVRRDWGRLLFRVAVPATVLVGCTFALIGYHNWRVTGEPERFPYMAHEDQYASAPTFLWQERGPEPEYRHSTIAEYWRTHGAKRFEAYQQPWVFAQLSARNTLRNFLFFLGPGIVVLVYLGRAVRDRWILFAALVSAGLLLAGLATAWSYPHYMAPAASLVFVTFAACLMKMLRARAERGWGTRRMALVMIAFAVSPLVGFDPYVASQSFAEQRAEVRERLMDSSGTDLVIVRYGRGHDLHDEWVYNRADLTEAEIIWARDMRPRENRELVRHFSEREVWDLYVSPDSVRLRDRASGSGAPGEPRLR